MKKFTWTMGCLVFLAMGSSSVMAEQKESGGRGPRFGVEGGFNVASLNGQQTPGAVYASRLGFVGGLFLQLPLGTSLSLRPEVLYSQKGGKINGVDYALDYVEIPVLLNVNVIGPLGLLMGPSFNANVATPAGVTVNATDVGIVGGAQVDLFNFLVSARYEVGLLDLNSNSKLQNGTFTLLAGIYFL
jgi:hypothetical protein